MRYPPAFVKQFIVISSQDDFIPPWPAAAQKRSIAPGIFLAGGAGKSSIGRDKDILRKLGKWGHARASNPIGKKLLIWHHPFTEQQNFPQGETRNEQIPV